MYVIVLCLLQIICPLPSIYVALPASFCVRSPAQKIGKGGLPSIADKQQSPLTIKNSTMIRPKIRKASEQYEHWEDHLCKEWDGMALWHR